MIFQYLNPNCRYILRSQKPGSGDLLVSIENSTCTRNNQSYLQSTMSIENNHVPLEQTKAQCSIQNQMQTVNHNTGHKNDKIRNDYKSQTHDHFCNPCIKHSNKDKIGNAEKDNVSLEAYDLASPCCEPHCVPMK